MSKDGNRISNTVYHADISVARQHGLNENFYDFINANSVFEHIATPLKGAQEISALL
jgi:hypothetical protein